MGVNSLGADQTDTERMNRKAKSIGLLVGISGQLYFTTISRISNVYIDHINGQWVAWREKHYTGEIEPSDVKVIAKAATFDYVVMKTKSYLEFIKKIRR
ncbi:hypothetical protein [Bacillus albus]|uniref:hypothetical protein n=1 Tax=Bacillus albus TaxID=2026189 RepID=UPI00101FF067|nr:hypothetical protein [Bacillus albus]